MTLFIEEFLTEFAQGYCERASDEFWPPAPLIVENLGWSRRTMRSNKQRFELFGDQINIKQTIVALNDFIICLLRVVIKSLR